MIASRVWPCHRVDPIVRSMQEIIDGIAGRKMIITERTEMAEPQMSNARSIRLTNQKVCISNRPLFAVFVPHQSSVYLNSYITDTCCAFSLLG